MIWNIRKLLINIPVWFKHHPIYWLSVHECLWCFHTLFYMLTCRYYHYPYLTLTLDICMFFSYRIIQYLIRIQTSHLLSKKKKSIHIKGVMIHWFVLMHPFYSWKYNAPMCPHKYWYVSWFIYIHCAYTWGSEQASVCTHEVLSKRIRCERAHRLPVIGEQRLSERVDIVLFNVAQI